MAFDSYTGTPWTRHHTKGGIFIFFCMFVGIVCRIFERHIPLRLPYSILLLLLGIGFGCWECYSEHTYSARPHFWNILHKWPCHIECSSPM